MKPAKQNNEWKYKAAIFFAIATIAIGPIITIFFVPPDSMMPIRVAGLIVLFWMLFLAGFILKFVFTSIRDKSRLIKETENGLKGQGKEPIKVKNGILTDYKLFKNEEKLFIALSILMSGDSKAFKKLQLKTNITMIKIAAWVIVVVLFVPVSALGLINPFIIVIWIGILFIHLLYSYLKNNFTSSRYLNEARTFGLTFNKKEMKAEKSNITVYFMDHARETIIKGNIGIFTAKVKKKEFIIDGNPEEKVRQIFEELESHKLYKFWRNVQIKSDGNKIQFIRKGNYDSLFAISMDFWYLDVWLGEFLVAKCK
jgi:hypothetical protein